MKYVAIRGLTNNSLPRGAVGELDVAEPAADRGRDLTVDDAGPHRGVELRVRDRVEVELRLLARARNRQRAQVRTVAVQGREVLQYVCVTHAVVGVDAEAQAHDQPYGHIHSGDGRQAGHVLLRRAEARLVAAHQDVGAAVDEDDGVDAQPPDQFPVRVPQRPDPVRGKAQTVASMPRA